MSNNGYIPISRRIFEHRFWCEDREYSRFEAWLDLLQSARFENATQYVGKYRQQRLKRGQQVAAVRYLAERWGWGKKRVELFLSYLMDEGMITKETSKETGITIITIIKYDTYNRNSLEEGTIEETAGRQQGDTRETNINKVNKGNNTTLTGSDSCESTERKRQKRGDCKGGAPKSPDWRNDFEVYLSDLRTVYSALMVDSEWLRQQQRINPGVDVPLSLEKACINFWATEGGWQNKKGKKTARINWKQTLANAITSPQNRVYNERLTKTTGTNSAREAEKRAGRAELDGLAAAILSGAPGKANQ